MGEQLVGNMKQVFHRLDGSLIKGSAVLSAGMVLARFLGLAFSFVLAAALSPSEFGTVQYGITLGQLLAIGAQPFGQHVLARFTGRYRREPEQLGRIVSNGLVMVAAITALTMIIAFFLPVIQGPSGIGALAVLLGFSAFYSYWGLASGSQAPVRLTLVYLSSNIVQIAMTLVLVYGLNIRAPLPALLVYGLSYFLPLALVQWRRPLPITFDWGWVDRRTVNELSRFALPIWLSHASYTLTVTLDILLLEHFFGVAAIAPYGVARTLAMVFGFLPTSIAVFLMPRVADSNRGVEHSLLSKMLAISTVVNICILVVYLLLVRWFVGIAFGTEYVIALPVYILLAANGIVGGINGIITAVMVGGGDPGIETISRLVALMVSASVGWTLVPDYGATGAAGAMLAGTLAALMVYVVALRTAGPGQSASTGSSGYESTRVGRR